PEPRHPVDKPAERRVHVARSEVDQPRLPIVIPSLEPHKVPVITRTIRNGSVLVHNALPTVPFIGIALWILPRWNPSPSHPDTRAAPHRFAGIREIARQPYLRGALATIFATSVFCSPLIAFIPVLVKVAFHGDAGRFSM